MYIRKNTEFYGEKKEKFTQDNCLFLPLQSNRNEWEAMSPL